MARRGQWQVWIPVFGRRTPGLFSVALISHFLGPAYSGDSYHNAVSGYGWADMARRAFLPTVLGKKRSDLARTVEFRLQSDILQLQRVAEQGNLW
ncbi:MAG: hypothetical protein CMF59_16850 [Leptospiraceae bacterium]|nr:hypothetical protein [Leptospiraceae bacterium]